MEDICTECDPGGAVHRAQGSRVDSPRQARPRCSLAIPADGTWSASSTTGGPP